MTLESSSTAAARGLACGAPSQLATGSNGLLQGLDNRQQIKCTDTIENHADPGARNWRHLIMFDGELDGEFLS
eukprot:3030486-Rhodomonas_salina.1